MLSGKWKLCKVRALRGGMAAGMLFIRGDTGVPASETVQAFCRYPQEFTLLEIFRYWMASSTLLQLFRASHMHSTH